MITVTSFAFFFKPALKADLFTQPPVTLLFKEIKKIEERVYEEADNKISDFSKWFSKEPPCSLH